MKTLSNTEVNLLIAALMLTAIRYDNLNKEEAERYRNLEYKFRNHCYQADKHVSLTD